MEDLQQAYSVNAHTLLGVKSVQREYGRAQSALRYSPRSGTTEGDVHSYLHVQTFAILHNHSFLSNFTESSSMFQHNIFSKKKMLCCVCWLVGWLKCDLDLLCSLAMSSSGRSSG